MGSFDVISICVPGLLAAVVAALEEGLGVAIPGSVGNAKPVACMALLEKLATDEGKRGLVGGNSWVGGVGLWCKLGLGVRICTTCGSALPPWKLAMDGKRG